MTATLPAAEPQARTALDRGTARTTGVLYLGLAVAGMLGFLVLRPVLVDPDPATTLANLREHEVLARWRIASEMALVVLQVLAALWFFRLFRGVDAFAAAAIAVFGTLNAVAVMGSAASLATGLEAAVGGHDWGTATPQLMHELSASSWGVGNLFFGLWLVPMGWCVLRSGTMPRLLGRLLVVGGAGYVLSGFATYLLPDAELLAEVLVAPASAGELWMVGHLLVAAGRRRT
jgi:hypothetical protein